MQLSLYYFSIINCLLALSFGAFIILRDRKNPIKQLYVLLALLTSVSSFAFSKWFFGNNSQDMLIWVKIYVAGLILMPVVYFHFVTYLLDIKRFRFILVYYLLSLYYILLVFIDFFISGITPRGIFPLWPEPKFLFHFFIASHYVVLILYLLYLLIDNYHKKLSLKKLQIKYFIVSTILAFVGWTSSFYLWYKIDIFPFGNIFISFYLLILLYVLSSQRLMDLRIILSKIYIYSVLVGFIFLFYSLIYYLDISILDTSFSIGNILIRLVFALLFAIAFIPFFEFTQKTGDFIFFKGYNPGHVIKDVLIKLSSVIDLDEMLEVLAEEFNKAIGSEKVGFLVFNLDSDDNIEGFKFNPSINLSFIFHPSDFLLEKLEKEKSIIIRGELGPDERKISQEMDFHHVKNIAPLIFKNKIIGLLIINDKLSGESFTQEEIEFIEVMGRQASVAIVNTMLYKEVGDLNKKLEEKYKKQTTDLKEKNENMQEFFKLSSYRLRSHLLDIKGILKKELGSASVNRKNSGFLKDSYAKALKSADIVNDILQATEMDSGDFKFENTKVDIKKLLKKICDEEIIEAKIKNIYLKLELPKNKISPIAGNIKYLEQAITSLVNNSIVYTFKGGVNISVEETNGEVSIRIKDSGIGISQKDIPRLFMKFNRAKNAVKAYEEGSGLGLFIVKSIIDAHPGASIGIEKTSLGKGSTFILKFPASIK